ncbi:hypothetical protein [Candidatus Phytoplasma melaleucae]|uniref:Effector n=1 Tax=Candidatus Phytoplasma melaleucae TaxID=2982630 RepID=A0ABT9DF81_9MOLU|nr:hypothetical protein ['Melaleuca sp.' phytoplasma]MDO8167934.1 hypothetical protein ['Melaleuca sp.' phytoplasma]MDV3205158.1 hypothetical protein [Weeping tea tree witches'-broom phytoplasma]
MSLKFFLNLLFFCVFNFVVATAGAILYKKALEQENLYQYKMLPISKNVSSSFPKSFSFLSPKLTLYDKFLHKWLELIQKIINKLNYWTKGYLSSILPTDNMIDIPFYG